MTGVASIECLLAQSKPRIPEEVIDGQELRHDPRLGVGGLGGEDRVPEPLVLSTDDLRHEGLVEPVRRPIQ